MNKHWTIAVLALGLGACGGGGEDDVPLDTAGTDVPASLTSPTDSAMAAAALMDFISMTGGFGIQGSFSGKAAAKDDSPPCETGQKAFAPDQATLFADDGQTIFAECTQTVGSQQFTEHGVRTTRCTDDNQTATHCDRLNSFAGRDKQPLRFEAVGPGFDQRILAFGTGLESSTGDRFADGIEQYDNLIAHKSATLVFDNMFLFASAASGSRTALIGGDYGLSDMARATANCISGKLTVSTPQQEALVIDQNENVVGGHLHFVSAAGSTGDVVFQPDHSVRASVNGGTPQTFTFSQYRAFCSIQ